MFNIQHSTSLFGVRHSIFYLTILCACSQSTSNNESPITLNLWYGDHQQFGTPGLAQHWINVLGNVQSPHGIKEMSYRLNGSSPVKLTLGSDLHRLAAPGDFNIDLHVDSCLEGKNDLQILVADSAENRLSHQIELQIDKNRTWPLPYSIQWSEVSDLQQTVQIVDGHWEITEAGIHNLDTYYDRVIAIGDSTWKNYEVTTSVVFHGFTTPQPGPPTYNVSHAAIASRWPGHDIDELQPHRKWYPLGATSEFRLTAGLDSCRWRIFDGPKPGTENFHVEQSSETFRSIELEKKYGMKHRVESLDSGRTRYSVKLWPYDLVEPESWDFQGIEQNENIKAGSALLIAHNTGVTFGDVIVKAINNEQ